jgi:hypothetical protein
VARHRRPVPDDAAIEASRADPYPEHAKLYPFSAYEPVEEFMMFLITSGRLDMSPLDIAPLIRVWRGVDEAAYQVESARLKLEYRWLWEQCGMSVDTPVEKVKWKIRQVGAPVSQAVEVDALSVLLSNIRRQSE